MARSKNSKKKHNKKRNTAFLYEALTRELTKTVLSKDKTRQDAIIQICKEHFHKGTLLYREKELYSAILETTDVDKEVASRMLEEAKKQRSDIDDRKLFDEQSALISKINKALNGNPFGNFVPGYKNLATVSQIFSKTTSVKERVLLEQSLVERMCATEEKKKEEELKSIDSLTYKTFVKKFNEQYGDILLEEQKDLITRYVMSFVDNGVELKYYLNEEIGRLKEGVKVALENQEIKGDGYMEEKTGMVFSLLESMNQKPVDEEMVSKILKIQQLVSETRENKNDS